MANQFSESENPRWQGKFYSIWGGQAVSLIGSQLVSFALIWYLTNLTGSAKVLAAASLCSVLPNLVLSPFTGAIADRFDRRKIMIFADFAIAAVTAFLALLFYLQWAQIWHIYALMFLRSVGGAFHWPAMQASTSLLVPREKFTKIQGLNQSLRGVLNILSPLLGAFAMDRMQIGAILAIDVITAACAIAPLFFTSIPQVHDDHIGQKVFAVKTIFEDLGEGFRYLYHWKAMFTLLIGSALINFSLAPSSAMLPLLVKQYFGYGAHELGWLQSAVSIGVVAGSLLLMVWGGFKRRMMTGLVGLIIVGGGAVMLGLLPAHLFYAAIPAVFIHGFGLPLASGPIFAIFQEKIDPRMQGRVFALINTTGQGAAPLGLLLAGLLSDTLGLQVWYVAGGLTCILLGIIYRLLPSMVDLEKEETAKTLQEDPAGI
ncbi:MAG: MFS transporter [Anaerolineaceae bacterium]|nr:MFS transporter [Anaerolineaceae bacterium]